MSSRFTTGFTWPAENYLLVNSVNSGLLYDIERRVFLWQYKTVGNDLGLTQVQDDQFVFIASSSDSRAVFPAMAPHAKPLAMAKQLDPADLLVLKPGSKVSIRMETNYTPGDNQKAFDAISKKLRDNGVEAVQSSSLVVVALSKKGKPREQTYSSFRSFEKTTRTITPLIYSLTMYEGQNNIYQTSGSGGLLA
jgi:hypothetical protein